MPELLHTLANAQATLRQHLTRELEGQLLSCRELSQAVHQSEKQVLEHLEHLRLSLRQQGKKLATTPAICRNCDYLFSQRSRLAKPGKCPVCRHTGIEPPLFTIIDI